MPSINPVETRALHLIASDAFDVWRGWKYGSAVLAVILTWMFVVAMKRRYFSPLSHIPGPFLASFTRAWHIQKVWKGHQNLDLIEAHEKYGHFVRISHDEVSVSHPDAVKALLLSPLVKGNWYRVMAFPDWRYPASTAIQSPREKAEFMRYQSNAGFSKSNILRRESDVIDPHIQGLLRWMDHYSSAASPSASIRNESSRLLPSAMPLSKFFTYTAYDLVGSLTFSQSLGFLDNGQDIAGAIAMNAYLSLFCSVLGFLLPLSYLLSNPLATRLGLVPSGHLVNTATRALSSRFQSGRSDEKALMSRLMGAILDEGAKDERVQGKSNEAGNQDSTRTESHDDMATHWFEGLRKAKAQGATTYTETHLLTAAVSNLGAGSDTVSCGLSSVIYHLARRPDLWSRVRAEIDEAAVSRRNGQQVYYEAGGKGGVLSYRDAAQLPLLNACIKEGLRFLPPVSMGFPRVAPEGGLTIGNETFPRGTTLSVSPAVIHHSKQIWGPDASDFNPDRWFAPDIGTKERYFIPWSQGWTTCPGVHLAQVEMLKITGTIIRDYDIRLVNPDEPLRYDAYFTTILKDWPVYVSRRRLRLDVGFDRHTETCSGVDGDGRSDSPYSRAFFGFL